jgi:hypothetical protein
MKKGNTLKNAFLKVLHAIKRDKLGQNKAKNFTKYRPLRLHVKYFAQTVYANRKRNERQRNPVHYATVSASAARHLVATGQAEVITPGQYFKNLHLNKVNVIK